jgi:amidohydrolase
MVHCAGKFFLNGMNMLKEEIKSLAREAFAHVIANRNHLHAHPELSFMEYETAAFIKSRLEEMGIAWQAVGETGVVALIRGDKEGGGTVALRADIDALPITELNDLPYTSRKQRRHACLRA